MDGIKVPISSLTPMMRQYVSIKNNHTDALLFYRMGDFYELFFDDAIIASSVLDIALTKRGKANGKDIPMCGVPVHSNLVYLHKLIKHGHNVAICEQLETPQEAKKRGSSIVRRDVVRITTPGTLVEDNLLNTKETNYVCAIAEHKGALAIAWADVSTGAFYVEITHINSIAFEIARIKPSEVLVADKLLKENSRISQAVHNVHTTARSHSLYEITRSVSKLKSFYNIDSVDGISSFCDSEIIAMGVLIDYIEHTHRENVPKLHYPNKVEHKHFISIPHATRKSLELTVDLSGSRNNTLLKTLDHTMTAMGSRLLYTHISSPLYDANTINKRLDYLEAMYSDQSLCDKIREYLKHFPDTERALNRIVSKRGTPQDLACIRDGLYIGLQIEELLLNSETLSSMPSLKSEIGNFDTILAELESALNIDGYYFECEQATHHSKYINKGYNAPLDRLYDIKFNANNSVNALQERYRKSLNINNLKITKNNVLGYFIEITPMHADKVNNDKFIHRQSLSTSTRYVTDELKQLENDIISCDEKINIIEEGVLLNLCELVSDYNDLISIVSHNIAKIDVISNLAYVAKKNNYVRPIIDDGYEINIKDGRHPVVEESLSKKDSQQFVTNSFHIDPEKSIWLITGPNMAGKSTFLRQNALIIIMAQMGSFVPAKYAKIGVVDQLFSRIGTGDNIADGQSTFMLEMIETSYILNNATDRSFLLLDEIGRGTATYDGLSIAWAILESIHNTIKARSIFATHYHELTKLENDLPHIECHTMSVEEWKDKLIFLHKVIKGKADKSYGIHVAKLAGMREDITARAYDILCDLSDDEGK